MSQGIPDLDKMRANMATAAVAMMPSLRKLGERFAVAGRLLDKAMWTTYREAGAIYGDNVEGRDRWLREIGQVQQLRAEARELELHHESLRRVAEKRRAREREVERP